MRDMAKKLLLITSLLVAGWPAEVRASGETSGSTTTTKTSEATAGDPWTARWGALGPTYDEAVELLEGGDIQKGMAKLVEFRTATPDKANDPRVMNWLGYGFRKSGDLEKAFAWYNATIGAAPDYTPAYEYLGEAYLDKGDMEKAKQTLEKIAELCGDTSCEEYGDLSVAIATKESEKSWFSWIFGG